MGGLFGGLFTPLKTLRASVGPSSTTSKSNSKEVWCDGRILYTEMRALRLPCLSFGLFVPAFFDKFVVFCVEQFRAFEVFA